MSFSSFNDIFDQDFEPGQGLNEMIHDLRIQLDPTNTELQTMEFVPDYSGEPGAALDQLPWPKSRYVMIQKGANYLVWLADDVSGRQYDPYDLRSRQFSGQNLAFELLRLWLNWYMCEEKAKNV